MAAKKRRRKSGKSSGPATRAERIDPAGPERPPAPGGGSKSVPMVLVSAVIFAAAMFLFLPTWNNPFVLDDVQKIEKNPDLAVPFALKFFVYPYSGTNTEFRNDPSRPLTFMLYWLCWKAGSGNPLPFHVANTLIHALMAILLFWFSAGLMGRLFGSYALAPAALAAALFLSSPLMAGTIAYAYGLSDVLSAALCLGALLLLVRRRDSRPGTQILAGGLFLLALCAKQGAIVLPGLVMAYDVAVGGWNEWKGRVRVYIPLLLLAAGYLGARWLYFGSFGDLEGAGSLHPAGFYAAMQGPMILAYLRMIGIPSGLTIDHLPVTAAYPAGFRLFAWGVVGTLTALAVRAGFKKSSGPIQRLLGFGWLFFLISLLPTSSVLPTVDLLVERRAYFAGVGIFIGLAGFLWSLGRRAGRRRSALLVAVAVVILAQTAVTWHRNGIYGSPEALWKEAIARNPMNRRAWSNLGTYYTQRARWDEAAAVFEKILSYNPDDGSVLAKLAYIYAEPGYAEHDDGKALEYLDRGLALNPENFIGFFNRAIILIRMERVAEAEASLRRAVALSPSYVPAHFMLGEVALGSGRTGEALAHYREVLRLNPGDAAATGRIREITGR